MGSSKKKTEQALDFRNFSPFYDRAMADARRDENILRLVEKDIERRKWISYSELTAAQRLVQRDLQQLRMAKRKHKEEKLVRQARSMSDPSYQLEDYAREKLRPSEKTKGVETEFVRQLTFPCIRKQISMVHSSKSSERLYSRTEAEETRKPARRRG